MIWLTRYGLGSKKTTIFFTSMTLVHRSTTRVARDYVGLQNVNSIMQLLKTRMQMASTTMEELKPFNDEYSVPRSTYKEKLDAAAAKYEEFPIVDEKEFWKHMAYTVAESADMCSRAMRQEHENMLAFKFELDKREREFNFPHMSPLEIEKQWEDHKIAVREKLDEMRGDR